MLLIVRVNAEMAPESNIYDPLWGEESIPGTESGTDKPSYKGCRAGTTTLCLLGS